MNHRLFEKPIGSKQLACAARQTPCQHNPVCIVPLETSHGDGYAVDAGKKRMDG